MKKIFLLFCFTVPLVNAQEHCDKWYVITTINKPTAVFEKFSKLSGWKGVVVADKKTPKDWYVPGITVLTVEYQQNCNYKIAKLLPWNHYCRKNIGYLYAIEHGAQIIYETDDDNFLIDDRIHYLPEKAECLLASAQLIFNPYVYFGQPSMWPRGFPLKEIGKSNNDHNQMIKECFIPIQQGLVNKDPDVDAIFRLTRNELVTFDSSKPSIACNAGTMAPFNSQNTLFYYSSFWLLFMPTTVSMRVADIWRGYWAQRLLWDIGGSLCFLPPTAYQERNQHDYLRDFAEEIDLYLDAQNLITMLNAWQSDKQTVFERMKDLFDELVIDKFLRQEDVILLQAWLEDLIAVGYIPPKIVK
jgi:STELLO glycosyltransferase-like protein